LPKPHMRRRGGSRPTRRRSRSAPSR
jgi:hypothetical protein